MLRQTAVELKLKWDLGSVYRIGGSQRCAFKKPQHSEESQKRVYEEDAGYLSKRHRHRNQNSGEEESTEKLLDWGL